MALNLDLIGQKTEPIPFTYDADRVILYALGVGAGVEELDFVYEKNLKVLPTFAAIPASLPFLKVTKGARVNVPKALHMEQKIVLFDRIPTSGTIFTTGVIKAIYDKRDKGAFINVLTESKDENGHPLFENHVAVVDRSAGNFGGDRGPKVEAINPPEGARPDFHVQYATWSNQHALYRLSGDKNPLHIDPEFARIGGMDRPILHGLCTLGFAARAILHSVCGNEPTRLKSISARFTGVVYPGDILVIEGWSSGQGRYVFQTKTQDGRIVLGSSLAEVA
jgi:acyl dehydratase